jgi:hypothetical protein
MIMKDLTPFFQIGAGGRGGDGDFDRVLDDDGDRGGSDQRAEIVGGFCGQAVVGGGT